MKTTMRIGLLVLATATAALLSNASAHAWGCIAVAPDGTYGYSYNYDNEDDAVERALDECVDRTGETCTIVECDEET